MGEFPVFYVDAFTTTPFLGNPCAVVLDADELSTDVMQMVARETNLPETSFVLASSQAEFKVRYFTPRKEIPFAGHPTIATAFIMAESRRIPLIDSTTRVDVEFSIGVLPVTIHLQNGRPTDVVMSQQLPVFGRTVPSCEIAACFNLETVELRADCPCQVVSTGVPFLIVPLSSLDVLKKIAMNRERLRQVCKELGISAAYLFAMGGFSPQTDVHARFFDPDSPVEDPFTGSACGAMAAFSVHYGLKAGPSIMVEQGHFINRPGIGTVEIVGPPNNIRAVTLGGAAVLTMEGSIHVPHDMVLSEHAAARQGGD